MKLNHLNLIVSNVSEAIKFFETYFNFKCVEVKGDHVIAVLTGEGGFTLVVMTNKEGAATYPSAFHIGFMLESEEGVNDVYNKLQSGGFQLPQEPRKIRDSFGFYFNFEKIMIEVAVG